MSFSTLTSILIVGFGSIGQRHLQIARELFPESKIGILFHNKTNEIPNYANEIFFSLSDAIQFKPQIAIVCSPAPTHFEITTALVRKGIHVLIEKPLSNESKGLEDAMGLKSEEQSFINFLHSVGLSIFLCWYTIHLF